jgi:TPR repeat protein
MSSMNAGGTRSVNVNRYFAMTCLLAAGLLAACGGDTVADKEQTVLKEAQAAYYRKDYPTALQGFRILADRGNARARFFLAEMYLSGAGVKQDYAEALSLARAAAEQGSAEAQYTLGGMYERGQGVAQDARQALMWYSLSAATGDEQAIRKKAALETTLAPGQVEEARRQEQEWIKAHQTR